MKILIVHNHYLEHGGEDEVVDAEKRMLEKFGHQVVLYERSNREIEELGLFKKARFILKEIYWSQGVYQQLRALIQKEKPTLAHIHNTFIKITSCVYDACQDEGLPIVQTFHNYRFLCPAATFYRQGRVCEDCLKYGRVSAVVHRCWRNSFLLSWALKGVVDRFYRDRTLEKITKGIVLSQFSKELYVKCGFDRRKLFVKPNFIDFDPGVSNGEKNYALFVGALRDYKGIKTLLKAWQKLDAAFPLKIIGEGPLRGLVEASVSEGKIEFFGPKPFQEMITYLKNARFIVVPSECYENFPRIIAEAFACGVPVIASRLGAMQELITEYKTGLLFNPRDADDLARQAQALISDKAMADRLGEDARLEYENLHTLEKNYKALMVIYQAAIEVNQGKPK